VISLAILAFTATDRFALALPCVFVAGTAMTITGIGAQTLLQAAVDVRMRGRIMALYGMIFRAGPAVGAVLMGSLSETFGLRLPLAVGCPRLLRLLGAEPPEAKAHGRNARGRPGGNAGAANPHDRVASLLFRFWLQRGWRWPAVS